jgi:beta-galactosidase/beta-glucuronidase
VWKMRGVRYEIFTSRARESLEERLINDIRESGERERERESYWRFEGILFDVSIGMVTKIKLGDLSVPRDFICLLIITIFFSS